MAETEDFGEGSTVISIPAWKPDSSKQFSKTEWSHGNAERCNLTFVVEAQVDSGTRHQVTAALALGKKVAFLNSLADQNFPWVTNAIQTGNGVIIKSMDDAIALLSAVIRSKPSSAKPRSDSESDSAQFQLISC